MATGSLPARAGTNGRPVRGKRGATRTKAYILDTSTIIHDPDCLLQFEENHVLIPYVTVCELDALRKGENGRGRSAREAIRFLERLRQESPTIRDCALPSGGKLSVIGATDEVFRDVGDGRVPHDDIILRIARQFIAEEGGAFDKVAVVSNDTGMRIKAAVVGIPAETYERGAVPAKVTYKGRLEEPIEADEERLQDLRVNGWMEIPESAEGMEANQYAVVRSACRKHSYIVRRRGPVLHRGNGTIEAHGIRGKNAEQSMALDLLCADDVALVALLGPAGVGKTLLSLAAGLHQTLGGGARYDQLICIKPIVPVGGQDLGYLPGAKEEKLHPWMAPYIHNLNYLGGYGYADRMLAEGIVKLEAMTYIRGSSIPKSWIMVDEAQNLTPKEIKTAITRAGEGSKVVLLADPSQIDAPYLDRESCGIMHVINAFKGQPIFGMVQLEKSERSELAALSARLL